MGIVKKVPVSRCVDVKINPLAIWWDGRNHLALAVDRGSTGIVVTVAWYLASRQPRK